MTIMQNKISIPDLPLKGGCQCGAVRYVLTNKPIVFYICHCTRCQKQSSSAFGESFRVYAADLEVAGEMKTLQRTAPSGFTFSCDFCPNCGSRLFHQREENEAVVNIKAGSLDDTSWLKPAGHIWTSSKQAWVIIPDDALVYEQQPDNYDELVKRWAEIVE